MTKILNVRKKQLIIILGVLLLGGFLSTSLVSYYTAISALREEIAGSSLPLTSDNIYSEIQRDLLQPVFISSLMANDTFVRDWVLSGENDPNKMIKYLKEIMVKYNVFTSFFVSERTRYYYHANRILKKVTKDEPRDAWYFRVRKMKDDYEINLDPDLANKDELTIFINQKVFDYSGQYIGATGVGLTTNAVKKLIDNYSRKYCRNIFFVDKRGKIILHNSVFKDKHNNILKLKGFKKTAKDILGNEQYVGYFNHDGRVTHVNSRLIPELDWYLVVMQEESSRIRNLNKALILNLAVCGLITAIVLVLTLITIKAFQKFTHQQQEEIVKQNQEMLSKNEKLEKALSEVKELSGLLPICASCKKIRDDKGYWQQLEEYFSCHTKAEFSHGICPDCTKSLYPEIYQKQQSDKTEES